MNLPEDAAKQRAGATITTIRTRLNWSRDDLTRRLHIPTEDLVAIESGTKDITIGELGLILGAMGYRVDFSTWQSEDVPAPAS